MSEQCPPVGCIHRVVYSVQLVDCGKTFCTVHPHNELWKVFPPTFQPAGIDTAISDLVAATQPPEHIAAVTAYERKLLKQADDTAASYEVLPCGLTRETLRDLLYLTTDCGALHKDNPLQQLNGVLARRFEDTDALHGAAHFIFLARTALDALPRVELKDGDTLCWAALVQQDRLPQVMSKLKEGVVLYSEAYVSAVQSRQDLESVINAAAELLSDFDSTLKSHALVVFAMDVGSSDSSHPLVAHDISALECGTDAQTLLREVLLDPGFEATVTSVSDGTPIAPNGIAVAKVVHLHFEQDTKFFAAPMRAQKPYPCTHKPLPLPKVIPTPPVEQPPVEQQPVEPAPVEQKPIEQVPTIREENSSEQEKAVLDLPVPSTDALSLREKQVLNMLQLLEEEQDVDNACDLLSQILTAVNQEQLSVKFVIDYMLRVLVGQFKKYSDNPDVALQTSLIILSCTSENDAVKTAVTDSGVLEVFATLLTKFVCRADVVQACLAILVSTTSLQSNCAHPQMATLVPTVLSFVTSSSPKICEHALVILLKMSALSQYSALLSDNINTVTRCANLHNEVPSVCLAACKVFFKIALDKQHRQSLNCPTVVDCLTNMLRSNITNATITECTIWVLLCITISDVTLDALLKGRVVSLAVAALTTFIEYPRTVQYTTQLIYRFCGHQSLLDALRKSKAARPLVSVVALKCVPDSVRSAAIRALCMIFKDMSCSCFTATKLIPALLKVGLSANDSSPLKLDVIAALRVLSSDSTVALLMPQFHVDSQIIEMTMTLLGTHEYALAVASLFATLAEKNVLLAKDRATSVLLCLMSPTEIVRVNKTEEDDIRVWEQCCRTLTILLKRSPSAIAPSIERAFKAIVSLTCNHGMHPRLIGMEIDCFKSFQKLSLFPSFFFLFS